MSSTYARPIHYYHNTRAIVIPFMADIDDFVDAIISLAVHFYKRAQIFASDVWSHFKGRGYGRFHDIKTLTMFPDYR